MKITDSKIFPLPGTRERFLHLATIHDSLKEYMHFYDSWTGKLYTEEITGGHLSFVQDNKKAEELDNFLSMSGAHGCLRICITDDIWKRHPLNKKFFSIHKTFIEKIKKDSKPKNMDISSG